jgi:hypothetical protein
VFLGLGPDNTGVPHTCVETDDPPILQPITVMNLDYNTTYIGYCVLTDNYPLWPTLQMTTASRPLYTQTFTTKPDPLVLEEQDDELASLLTAAWLVLFFIN